MKKITLFIVLSMVSLFFVGCGSDSSKNKKFNTIIENFRNGNYEYTSKGYSIESGQGKKYLYEMQGKLIADPYQQYEIGEMEEVYVYEKDGKIFEDMRLSTSDGEIKSISFESDKGSDLYIRENLEFTYLRDEIVDNSKLSVFSSEYEKTNVIAGKDRKISLPSKIKLEYYVDLEKEVVKKIVVDLSDSEKVDQIGRLMLEGKSEKDAKKLVDNCDESSIMKVDIDIHNFDGDIVIERPGMDSPD